MYRLALVLLLLVSVSANAQLGVQDSQQNMLHHDVRIDLLIKKQAQINEETTRDSRRSMPGYRIQVINTNNRNQAVEAKTKIYQLYPELKAYLLFQSPYFRLRVGNFKTHQEAESYLQSLTKQFGTTVTIMRDVIEVRPEKLNLDAFDQ